MVRKRLSKRERSPSSWPGADSREGGGRHAPPGALRDGPGGGGQSGRANSKKHKICCRMRQILNPPWKNPLPAPVSGAQRH